VLARLPLVTLGPVLLVLFASVAAGEARAVDTYEEERLAEVLEEEGLEAFEPAPDDRIRFVRIVRHPVFTNHDPYPDFLNWLHWKTEEIVVQREILFGEGDDYGELLEETGRNLRRMFIISLARVVPVRPKGGGEPGVLVFTRDLWSLRLEQDFQITGATIDRLLLQLTERNLFGRDKTLAARFQMGPATFSVGQFYFDRRLFGSLVRVSQSIDLVFQNLTFRPEGGRGTVNVGMPLRSLGQPFGFEVIGSFDISVFRQLRGSQILTWDDPRTVSRERTPRIWDQRRFELAGQVTRQFGSHVIQRLTAGVQLSDHFVAPNADTELAPLQWDSFLEHVLPVPRRQIGPYLRYGVFVDDFHVYEDLDSFGQSEVVRLGPSLSTTLFGGLRAGGSSTDFLLATASAGIAGDPSVETGARLEDGEVIDRRFAARIRAASAHYLYTRAFARFDVELRNRDSAKTLVTMGGDNGLRGYPSQAFYAFGASRAQLNLELRTRPLEWRSVQIGGALFYDAGLLFYDLAELDALDVKQAVGIGTRFLFPQFNKTPYRLDLGVPLDGSGFMVLVSFGGSQAVVHGTPGADPLAAVSTQN
jgi:hypothetical protein